MEMNAADLLRIAERCEKATGPDRELDCEIAVAALGFFVDAQGKYAYVDGEGVSHHSGQAPDMLVREFTVSLDAAMTLVPEEAFTKLTIAPQGNWASVYTSGEDADAYHSVRSATPALALTAACLRAIASKAEGR